MREGSVHLRSNPSATASWRNRADGDRRGANRENYACRSGATASWRNRADGDRRGANRENYGCRSGAATSRSDPRDQRRGRRDNNPGSSSRTQRTERNWRGTWRDERDHRDHRAAPRRSRTRRAAPRRSHSRRAPRRSRSRGPHPPQQWRSDRPQTPEIPPRAPVRPRLSDRDASVNGDRNRDRTRTPRSRTADRAEVEAVEAADIAVAEEEVKTLSCVHRVYWTKRDGWDGRRRTGGRAATGRLY